MPQKTDTIVEGTLVRWSDHELFRGMDHGALRALVGAMDTLVFEAGEAIVRQGERGDDMFLVEEGRVRVRVVDAAGDPVVERIIDPPTVMGEMALVTKEPRNATVEAVTQVKALRVGKAPFMALVRRAPSAAQFLTRAVGRRLMDSGGIRQVGKYTVLGHLGSGSLATVFEGVHPKLDQRVALKMLSHDLVLNSGFKAAFDSEAKIIAGLRHPNIVRVMDTEQAYGTHFIVMERMSGTDLQEQIDRGHKVPYDTLSRFLAEACEALQYCHDNGVLHRDVKPGNIFLTDEGQAKLIDFNIATAPEASKDAGGRVSGTPAFMAPEQCRGQQLDGRCDLYALGITAYVLVTGEQPFEAADYVDVLKMQVGTPMPDARELAPDLPLYLHEFIVRSTMKKREDRFATCGAAAVFLRTASELPLVKKLSLTTLAVSYHPSRAQFVGAALRRLYAELKDAPGVSVIYGHQGGMVSSEAEVKGKSGD